MPFTLRRSWKSTTSGGIEGRAHCTLIEGGGRSVITPSTTGSKRSARTPNAYVVAGSLGRAVGTRNEAARALATTSSQRADFPITQLARKHEERRAVLPRGPGAKTPAQQAVVDGGELPTARVALVAGCHEVVFSWPALQTPNSLPSGSP